MISYVLMLKSDSPNELNKNHSVISALHYTKAMISQGNVALKCNRAHANKHKTQTLFTCIVHKYSKREKDGNVYNSVWLVFFWVRALDFEWVNWFRLISKYLQRRRRRRHHDRKLFGRSITKIHLCENPNINHFQ